MGEESNESRPFQFFTDHIDPFIADATRAGRKREFADFAAFSGAAIPDPQAVDTFEASKLVGGPVDPFYAELIALRRELPRQLSLSADGGRLTMRRGEVELVADFDRHTVELRR
jgi:maltooligosyltrehalose trehalohydrolase